MNPVRWIALRWRAIAGRRALDRDMQEEMREHLDRAAERYAARGLLPVEARTAALREFGNVDVIQETARDARGGRWIDALKADVRFAFRHFGRRPLTTVTMVIVLALGVGANTVVFAGIQAFTNRPAPGVPRNDANVSLHAMERSSRTAAWDPRYFTHPEMLAIASRTDVFQDVTASLAHDVVLNVTDTSRAIAVSAEFVTPNYFRMVDVPLAAGPGFSPGDAPDFSAVMVFPVAEDLYGSAAAAIGRQVFVNDIPVRIAGVAPPDFRGAVPAGARSVLWLPLSTRTDIARRPRAWLDAPALALYARLAAGASREQAAALARHVLTTMIPDTVARLGAARDVRVLALHAPPPGLHTDDEVLFLVAAAGLTGMMILLVTCTNVSALLVAGAVARRHEIGVRLALGASRIRVLRQLLTESTLLSVSGGALGLLLYWWITVSVGRRFVQALNVQIEPDLLTAGFTALIAVATGVLFGLSPALHATKSGPAVALRDSGGGVVRRSRLQRGFVIAQIALSQPLVLVLATGVLAVRHEVRPMPDAVTNRVIRATFRPLSITGGPRQRREAVESLVPRLAEQPGIVNVVPEASTFESRPLSLPAGGNEAMPRGQIEIDGVSPGYFTLLEVPILLGRDVSYADTLGTEYNVVVGSGLARKIWGISNPLGQTVTMSGVGEGRRRDPIVLRVVGVVDASKPTTSDGPDRFYTSFGKHWRKDALLIRTHGSGASFLPDLHAMIRRDAPGVPLAGLETLASAEQRSRRDTFRFAGAFGAAGAVGVLLACLGLYSVVALAVNQRKREIGIRLAIGSTPRRIATMFLGSGVRVSVAGLVLGLPLSIVVLRAALAPHNEWVSDVWFAGLGVALLMLLVAAAAAWLPARNAARVDPATTLRVE